MADVTVSQFAQVLKVPVDRLIVQLDQAGIKVEGPDARISDEAKLELLSHLRKSHGADEQIGGSPNKITLKRKTQSELKLASTQGRARTVNVEVRRSRTYVKRDVLEEQNRVSQEGGDSKRREAEEAEKREQERLEAERHEPSGSRLRTAAASRRSRTARKRWRMHAAPRNSRRARMPNAAIGKPSAMFRRSRGS
ncbi:MAG: translation initiation factor IF-2 associated domain-containing protein [Steroidobacteraceae bacterium]